MILKKVAFYCSDIKIKSGLLLSLIFFFFASFFFGFPTSTFALNILDSEKIDSHFHSKIALKKLVQTSPTTKSSHLDKKKALLLSYKKNIKDQESAKRDGKNNHIARLSTLTAKTIKKGAQNKQRSKKKLVVVSSGYKNKVPQAKIIARGRMNSLQRKRVRIKRSYLDHHNYRYSKPRPRTVHFNPSLLNKDLNLFSIQLNNKFYFERILLRSHFFYIVDQFSNEPLFEKNSHVIAPIASITKLMTAIVVLDSGLPLDELLTITNEDRDYEKGTGSRLRLGSKLTRADMLHIALMSSENRAASALSRYYPGGRSAFVDKMNKKAYELGMFHTYFKNATGLSRQNVSTARDLVRLVEAAYRYPLIRKYSTDSSYTVHTGKKVLRYNSTNCLVKNSKWDIGVQKTGYIHEAGECLVMQASINSRPVIMVFLDANGKYSRIGDAETVRHWLLARR